ncbi:hypothetical protein D3C86_1999440 [compost metagenome]
MFTESKYAHRRSQTTGFPESCRSEFHFYPQIYEAQSEGLGNIAIFLRSGTGITLAAQLAQTEHFPIVYAAY